MALLGEGLDCPAGDRVAGSDGRNGNFVSQVTKLKGCVGASVYAGLILLSWGIFFERSS